MLDFSTTGADFARHLAAQLSSRGIALVDAPITGSVVTAGNGGLGIMCSGPSAAFARVEPLLRDLARAVVLYLGERSGRAQTLKLLNNLLSATGMATTCEAVLVGFKAGLDPWRMLEVINAGDASSSASRNKFAKSVLPRRFDYGARMAITAKDTSLTVGECEALGVPMWVGQAVRQVWNVAASQGGAERDASSLITFLEPWAGVELPASDAARPLADAVPSGVAPGVAIVCDASLQRDVVRAAGSAASVHVVDATAAAPRRCARRCRCAPGAASSSTCAPWPPRRHADWLRPWQAMVTATSRRCLSACRATSAPRARCSSSLARRRTAPIRRRCWRRWGAARWPCPARGRRGAAA